MAKSLDGIKKLNSEEAAKYRNIVLNYIGENEPAKIKKQITSQGALAARSLDGLKAGKIKLSLPLDADEDRLKQAIKKQAEMRKQVNEEDRRLRERAENDKRERREALKRDELRKKEIAARLKREAEEKKRKDEAKKWEEKIKLEEREREEKRLAEEKLLQEKNKRRQELKAVRKIAKEKRKNKRQEAINKFKNNLSMELRGLAMAVKKNYIYALSFTLLLLVTAYLTLCLSVLRLEFKDNIIVKQLINYLPVPSVITSEGVINFRDFQSLRNRGYPDLTLEQKKNYLAAWLAMRNLKKKYGLPLDATANDLAKKFVLDQDFNRVGLSRINKIRELLGGNNQLEQLGKYADEYNDGVYYSGNEAAQKFGLAILELAVGQISGIISQADGYYIIKKINDNNGRFGAQYVFVGARIWDEYLKNKSSETKVFILAN